MSEELKVGDRIKDNDPRMPNRVLKIIDLGVADQVRAVDSMGCVRWYSRYRIYTDSKPRKTGFTRIES